MTGAESVVVLVRKLDDRAAELGQVLIHEIYKLVAGEDSLILKDAYISPCVNDIGLHVPVRCIAKQICVVMKETRRTDNLAEASSFDIYGLHILRLKQPDKTVRLLLLLRCHRKTGEQDKNGI